MNVLQGPPETWDSVTSPTALSLGVFDGVHRGHRDLLDRAFAGSGRPAVITFDPHPVEVLATSVSPRLITTLEERLELLDNAGAELVAVLDLTDVRYLEPEDFVKSVLIDRMKVGSLTVGIDFRFGRNRAGDVPLLRRMGAEHGFEFRSVELVESGGSEISSSLIRNDIEAGRIVKANDLLGSRYQLSQTVVDGDKRGRLIGFPTANLRPPSRKVVPGDGVYATIASIGDESYIAATNVGRRPTFGGGERLVEAYLLDFDQDIYGRQLTLSFVDYLRPELNFENVDDLVAQMAGDIDQTRDIVTPVMD